MGYQERYGRKEEKSSYDTAGKTENFFTRNVRLITFLICVTVFLALFIPIAAIETIDYFRNMGDTRPQMTISDVVRLSKQNGRISEQQIENFKSEEKVKSNVTYYYIDIEPHYQVLAISDNTTNMLIYCQLTNFDTGETADMLLDDIEAFLNGGK